MRKVILSLFAVLFSMAVSAQDKNFTIDRSITGFEFEYADGPMYTYTLADYKTYSPDDIFPSIMISPMPEDLSVQAAIQQVEEEIEKGKAGGDQFIDYKKETLSFNNFKAAVLSVKAIEGGAETYVYMAFIEGNGQRLVFVGEDTEGGKYIDKIKATLKTLKLKS